MKLFTATFDDSDVVRLEPGIPVELHEGTLAADLGTDVGGATLAMIPLVIPAVGVETTGPHVERDEAGARRLLEADLHVDEETGLSFTPAPEGDARAFLVLSVIQRSPDARTEVADLGAGVACVGNAFDRPMDRQLLVLDAGARVEFRRFGRGGVYGDWHTLAWTGAELTLVRTSEGSA